MLKNNIKDLHKGVMNSIDAKRFRPQGAIIFLTYRCTSRCVACNIWQRPVQIEKELTWAEWEPIFRSLRQSGVKGIELFGGDALLRKELLVKMIECCAELGIKTYFPTNSSSLTKKTVADLVQAGLGTVYLSFDEPPEAQSSIRGVTRHLDRVIEAMRRFRSARGDSNTPRISCITTVSRMNFRGIRRLLEISHKEGVDDHMLRGISEFTNESVRLSAVNGIHPSPYFMPTDDKTHAFTVDEAAELLDILEWVRSNRHQFHPMTVDMSNLENLSQDDIAKLHYPKAKCIFASTQVILSPYGNVLPCLYFNKYHLGNAVTDDVSSIWGNKKHQEFCQQQYSDNIEICRHCSIKAYHKSFGATVKGLLSKGVREVVTNRVMRVTK